jgi:hypothetical protein
VTIQAWIRSAAGRRTGRKLAQRDGLLGRQRPVLLECGHERTDLQGLRRELRFADLASRTSRRLLRRAASLFGSLRVCLTSVCSRSAACTRGEGARGAAGTAGAATESTAREVASTAIQRTCSH